MWKEKTGNKNDVEGKSVGCLMLALRLPWAYVRNDPDDGFIIASYCEVATCPMIPTKPSTCIFRSV